MPLLRITNTSRLRQGDVIPDVCLRETRELSISGPDPEPTVGVHVAFWEVVRLLPNAEGPMIKWLGSFLFDLRTGGCETFELPQEPVGPLPPQRCYVVNGSLPADLRLRRKIANTLYECEQDRLRSQAWQFLG